MTLGELILSKPFLEGQKAKLHGQSVTFPSLTPEMEELVGARALAQARAERHTRGLPSSPAQNSIRGQTSRQERIDAVVQAIGEGDATLNDIQSKMGKTVHYVSSAIAEAVTAKAVCKRRVKGFALYRVRQEDEAEPMFSSVRARN